VAIAAGGEVALTLRTERILPPRCSPLRLAGTRQLRNPRRVVVEKEVPLAPEPLQAQDESDGSHPSRRCVGRLRPVSQSAAPVKWEC